MITSTRPFSVYIITKATSSTVRHAVKTSRTYTFADRYFRHAQRAGTGKRLALSSTRVGGIVSPKFSHTAHCYPWIFILWKNISVSSIIRPTIVHWIGALKASNLWFVPTDVVAYALCGNAGRACRTHRFLCRASEKPVVRGIT